MRIAHLIDLGKTAPSPPLGLDLEQRSLRDFACNGPNSFHGSWPLWSCSNSPWRASGMAVPFLFSLSGCSFLNRKSFF